MPRSCKCAITGERGTTDVFVKINGKYYKNQKIYDDAQQKKAKRKELIDYICREFLGYGNGQPFPTSLPKKINELSFYDDEVILETFMRCHSEIDYRLRYKRFNSEYGKLSYIFAIAKDSIADVYTEFVHKKKQRQVSESTELECGDLTDIGTKSRGKDISQFLCDDEF